MPCGCVWTAWSEGQSLVRGRKETIVWQNHLEEGLQKEGSAGHTAPGWQRHSAGVNMECWAAAMTCSWLLWATPLASHGNRCHQSTSWEAAYVVPVVGQQCAVGTTPGTGLAHFVHATRYSEQRKWMLFSEMVLSPVSLAGSIHQIWLHRQIITALLESSLFG